MHDAQGNIENIVASPPDSPVGYMQGNPVNTLPRLKCRSLTLDLSSEEMNERLGDLMENSRVDVGSREGKLTRQD
jgi:hypothetical protein